MGGTQAVETPDLEELRPAQRAKPLSRTRPPHPAGRAPRDQRVVAEGGQPGGGAGGLWPLVSEGSASLLPA